MTVIADMLGTGDEGSPSAGQKHLGNTWYLKWGLHWSKGTLAHLVSMSISFGANLDSRLCFSVGGHFNLPWTNRLALFWNLASWVVFTINSRRAITTNVLPYTAAFFFHKAEGDSEPEVIRGGHAPYAQIAVLATWQLSQKVIFACSDRKLTAFTLLSLRGGVSFFVMKKITDFPW